MQAEIITVGTELLLGRINNTNATFLAQQLANLGIEAYYQTVVGDSVDRIQKALTIAQKRSDLIILCGGLGPTRDDVTKEAVAKYLDLSLVVEESTWTAIQQRFAKLQRPLIDTNIKQAQRLPGSTTLANDNGLAIGEFYRDAAHQIVILPGPPSELELMTEKHLVPVLKREFHLENQLTSKVLRFYGLPESNLMSQIDDLVRHASNPSVASYAKYHEIWLRLTAFGQSNSVLEQLANQIIERLKPYYIGSGTQLDLADQVVAQLKQQHLKITAAESLTGGLFQSTICSVSGASNVFDGGFVTYSNESKHDLIGVKNDTIDRFGVVSEETAIEMAEKAKETMHVQVGVSFTGVAGPDALEGQPAGTVWVAVAQDGHPTISKQLNLPATDERQTIRQKSVLSVLQMLRQQLEK
ncbi:competence/damage-inducible protein A [Paucilactobacillus sp. N302-9]